MIIAVVNTKGGVGKTTCCLYLASALKEHGSVLVWDADHQASATDWAETAREDGDPLPFDVLPANRATLRRHVAADGIAYIIIDTPPGDPGTLDAAIAVADAVILPTEPSAMDMRRLWATLENLDPSKPRAVLLTKVNQATRAYRDAVEVLSSVEDVATFASSIPRREEIKNAFGTNPANLFTYPDVASELLEAMK